MSVVLVTGGSGFVGSQCILQLLGAGHQVRTTVRNLNRADDVRSMLKEGGADPANVIFVAADLESDAGWSEAVAGCDYVLHVASPFPAGNPKDEAELIRPAREGALRVLRAARDAAVKRVVLTSSFAAIGYGHGRQDAPFDETDWSDLDGGDIQPYIKSKILAERAAWDFIEREGDGLELSVINPVGVFGPVLGPDYSSSIGIVSTMLDGGMPACPRVYFGVVDVRDVADLHIRAMTSPAANGERFLAIGSSILSMLDVAQILKARMGTLAAKVPTRQLPDWMVRLTAIFKPALREVVPQLGLKRYATNEKSKRLLGWAPRSNEETISSTAESLVKLGLVVT